MRRDPTAHIVSVSCPLKIIANQVKQNNTHSAKEQRSTTDTFRCNGRRLYASRGQHFRNIVMRFTKRAARMRHVEPGLAATTVFAMDCVTREKPCLRRCHGITHKQRRTHTELPIASLLPVPLSLSRHREHTQNGVKGPDTCKNKAQIRAKGTTERAIHRTTRKTTSVIPKISRERIFPLRFKLIPKKLKTALDHSHYSF